MGSPNLVCWWTLVIFRSCEKVKVIGQRSRSPCQKCDFRIYLVYFIWASRSKVTRVKVKGHIGQVQMRVPKKGRWAHTNVKLLHYSCISMFNVVLYTYSTAPAGLFLRVSHSKLQYLGEISLSFDVHYDSIFLHFHSNYRGDVPRRVSYSSMVDFCL